MNNPFGMYHAVCPDTGDVLSYNLCDSEEPDGPKKGEPTVIFGFEKDLYLNAMRRCVGIPDVIFRRVVLKP